MVSLVLSGGGTRGAYEVGSYQAFLKCGVKINTIGGTSIGAVNAAFIASGHFKDLYNFWYNGNLSEILDLKKMFTSLDNLRDLIDKYDIAGKLLKSKMDFFLVTVEALTLKHEYVFKKDIDKELLTDYLIATCSLPVFKNEKLIDGKRYLDGGFYDNLPVNAINEGKVYAINLKEIGIVRKFNNPDDVIEITPSRKIGSILNTEQDIARENIKLGFYDTLKALKGLDGDKYIFKKRGNWFYNLLIRKVNKRVRERMENVLFTKDSKELIIKAIEQVMKDKGYTYYKIYDIYKVIKKINKLNKSYGVYAFIKELKLF